MNNVVHNHLNKLRLIARIKEGQSLSTTNGLSIYEPTWWYWTWRKIYADCKDEVVRCLHDIYITVDQSAEQLILEVKTAKDDKRIKLIDLVISFAEKIKASFAGIENLCRTYVKYPETVSNLEGIVQDIAFLTYKQLVSNIPDAYMTPYLRENITLNVIQINKLNDYQGEKEFHELKHIEPVNAISTEENNSPNIKKNKKLNN